MTDSRKLAPGIFVLLVAIVVVAAIFATRGCRQDGGETVEQTEIVETLPTPEPTPSLQERLSARLKGTTLVTSDAVIRELVAVLSARPELATWLVNDDLVRRFVASASNIADGKNPRQHLEFLGLEEGFQVIDRDGRTTMDPAGYGRYDKIVAVFVSLDTEGTAALYAELTPLIDDAYAEIAQPGSGFDDRLAAAIDELLEVPVLSGEVELQPRVLTFSYSDSELESLSPVQRQLLRMGPDNVRAVQAKLVELRSALH